MGTAGLFISEKMGESETETTLILEPQFKLSALNSEHRKNGSTGDRIEFLGQTVGSAREESREARREEEIFPYRKLGRKKGEEKRGI